MTITEQKAAELRKPFPKNVVGKLPKGGAQLDFVGHAATTDRLLIVDPAWSWEPFATDDSGLPALDRKGNLWIRLTVCGVTRIGVGDGISAKECIGDAIRNAAMRFGVALDLWSKDELEQTSVGVEKLRADLTAGGLGAALADSKPDTEAPSPLSESPLLDTSGKLAKRMFALFGDAEITDKELRLAYVSDAVGRVVASSKDMTDDDARKVSKALEAELEVRRQADAPDSYDEPPGWGTP